MPKHKSRAKRAAEASSHLTDAAAELRQVGEEITAMLEGEDAEAAEQFPAQRKAWDERLGKAEAAYEDGKSEVESLKEEMESWRDNIEEKFSATQKFAEVEEAVGGLDEATSTLDGVDWPALPADPCCDEELETFAEACDSTADEIESAAGEIDNVTFPGMF